MKIIIVILGIIFIISSYMHLFKSEFWAVRVFDFMHIQLSILLVICLLFYSIYFENFETWEFVFMGCLGISALFLGFIMLPYTPMYPSQVANADLKAVHDYSKINIMVSNVLQFNEECEKCLNLIDKVDPDLLLMVETDHKWQQELEKLEERYPYLLHNPLDNTYGILMYSKFELIDPEIRFLIEDDIPSISTKIKLKNGKIIQFFGIHPKPPSPTENDRSLERDVELIVVGKEARKVEIPVIVAGDLNDVAWSYTTKLFQKISGLLDPRVGRGFFNTFNAKYFFLRWPLDHVFFSRDFKICDMRVLPYIGSDHFPICITLAYTNNLNGNEVVPAPDEEEEEDIEEKLEELKEERNGKI